MRGCRVFASGGRVGLELGFRLDGGNEAGSFIGVLFAVSFFIFYVGGLVVGV